MKIIFSPTKTQKLVKSSVYNAVESDKTRHLKGKLLELNINEIQSIMKVSESLANDVYEVFHGDYAALPAYVLYEGPSFKALTPLHVESNKTNDVYVLSAYHGVVPLKKPIRPYRLDMGIRLLEKSLYVYWAEEMKSFFKPNEWVLSLASKEFEKLVPKDCHLIEVKFYNCVNGVLKSPSYDSKVARGRFLDYILEKNTEDISVLKAFTSDGYVYDASRSTEKEWVFVR